MTNDEVLAAARRVLERGNASLDEAEALFDALAAVRSEDILGRYRGEELATGHPLEGMLARYGFYGKDLVDVETVHPLLFRDGNGEVFRVDPRKVPLGLAPQASWVPGTLARGALSLVRAVIETTEPRARLRDTVLRGKTSATMIYDHLPIQDAFRRIDEDTLLGRMDRRGDARPLFFVLRRDQDLRR